MISYRCPMGPEICVGGVKSCSNRLLPTGAKDPTSWTTGCDQLSVLSEILQEHYPRSRNTNSTARVYYLFDCNEYDRRKKDNFSCETRNRKPHCLLGFANSIMSQGEGDKYWKNVKCRSVGSASEDEQHVSDASQDSQLDNYAIVDNNNVEEGCAIEDEMGQSPFLFLGPVGKKRKIVRDRHMSDNSNSPQSQVQSPPTPSDGLNSVTGDESASIVAPPITIADGRLGVRVPPTVIVTASSAKSQSTFTAPDEQPLNLTTGGGTGVEPLPSIFATSDIGGGTSLNLSFLPQENSEQIPFITPLASPTLSLSSRYDRESGEESQQSSVLGAMSPTLSVSLSPSSSTQEYNYAKGNAPNYVSTGGSPTKRKLQCPDCGKEFSQLRNYRYHRSRHEGTSQFACTCPICGKSFNDKGYLSSHLKIHRNAKEYQCEWCEKSFNQRVAYNMHVRIHTGLKPHKCHICPKAFSRKMLLRQHLRTHTGERPYSCEICSKAFADRSNMLLHQRLHSGQRPYKCDICGKSFSKNHHLKTHLNHHAGIKPYQCEKCKATFSQSSNMKTHFRKCSGAFSSSESLSTNSSVPQSSGSDNTLWDRASPLMQATSSSTTAFLPSLNTNFHRSQFHNSHPNLAQQFSTMTTEQATSFSALLHNQLRSSSVSSSYALPSPPLPSTSAAAGAASSANNYQLGLTGLLSPPIVVQPQATSPERFGIAKPLTRLSAVAAAGKISSSATKPTKIELQQQPMLHFTQLEPSSMVLTPSPLSPASSLLLMHHPTKPHFPHLSSHHHHHHLHSHPHATRVIQHTGSSSGIAITAAVNPITEFLEAAAGSEPLQHMIHSPPALQQHLIQQQQRSLHSPPVPVSFTHSVAPSLSPQSPTRSPLYHGGGVNLPLSLQRRMPMSPPSMSTYQHHLIQHLAMPNKSESAKIPPFPNIPRNIIVTTMANTTNNGRDTSQ